MYTKISSIKNALKGIEPGERVKYEILYITTTIETIDDIAEKELFDLGWFE